MKVLMRKNIGIMATKKVYDACCRNIQKMDLHIVTKAGEIRIRKPNMLFLFGKKELVTEKEFMYCSKREKRRHLMEDNILRSMYIELDSNMKFSIEHPNMVAHT